MVLAPILKNAELRLGLGRHELCGFCSPLRCSPLLYDCNIAVRPQLFPTLRVARFTLSALLRCCAICPVLRSRPLSVWSVLCALKLVFAIDSNPTSSGKPSHSSH
ncbi:hypothetical protein C8Q73DRAFT_706568 [Cubamyces lactineus]|nr:hypothetical protein C8Q73DRAFT_706568 [Cubamyces lactineus]